MKFSELPECCAFVVIQPGKEMPLLAKDSHSRVRRHCSWQLYLENGITQDTEVQRVYLRKPSCEE